ncbi:sialate O-acetylesterase [Erythrobacter sp.]|uniref:sialate O-acetylesterase n=1 Tax=Erythrobacter sp. TaxID=1042 RepID=UPI0025DC79D0|nr:sialate O-acetylesterase [Erythrobacter sp.]
MATAAILPAPVAAEELALGAPFSSGMVIQRGEPIPVWGSGNPGSTIKVTLGDTGLEANVKADGRWQVELPARAAATGLTLSVNAQGSAVQLRDVSIGEVILCSGQSNMVWKMSASSLRPEDRNLAIDENIRLLTVPQVSSLVEAPKFGMPGQWLKARDKWLDFSAVCLFAGRKVAEEEKVIVGLINASVGGTPIRSWLPREGLAVAGGMETQLAMLDAYRRDPATAPAQYAAKVSDVWEGRPRTEWAHKANQSYANLFNGMVAPLGPTRLAGAIWYQGENEANNAESTARYRTLLETLIKSWRGRFGSEVPFVVVQLAGFGPISGAADDDETAAIREAQRLVARDDPLTELVVTIDVSERLDIHPPIKKPVGQRAGAALLKLAYGKTDAYRPPEAISARRTGNAVEVVVSHANGALFAASWGRPGPFMLCDDPAGKACRFADAQFSEGGVTISVPQGASPVLVRYCWDAAPICNVFDATDLPLGPFALSID